MATMRAHLPTGTSLAPTPVSSGFLTGLGLETLRQQVQGTWARARLLACLPPFAPLCRAQPSPAGASGNPDASLAPRPSAPRALQRAGGCMMVYTLGETPVGRICCRTLK